MEKRGILGVLLVVLLFVVLNLSSVNSLGVAPARIQLSYFQGEEKYFSFNVLGVEEDTEVEISVTGELAEYVKLDRNTLIGSGEFNVVFTNPEVVDHPGPNRAYINVKEKVDEELAGTQIGTRVTIISVIDLFVPYPGKYADINLVGHNVNVGDPVLFELEIIGRGDQNTTISPRIEIEDNNDKFIESLLFEERDLKVQEKVKLKKFLLTEDYNPGVYEAIAIVQFGGDRDAVDSQIFRIGELRIDIIDTTKQMIIDKIQRFDITIASGWNDQISGAFADVSISKGGVVIQELQTTTTKLTPWQEKNISGFVDTSLFEPGIYDADITLNYFGKDEGRTESKIVKVEFIEKPFNYTPIIYSLSGLILLLLIIILIKMFFFGKKKK